MELSEIIDLKTIQNLIENNYLFKILHYLFILLLTNSYIHAFNSDKIFGRSTKSIFLNIFEIRIYELTTADNIFFKIHIYEVLIAVFVLTLCEKLITLHVNQVLRIYINESDDITKMISELSYIKSIGYSETKYNRLKNKLKHLHVFSVFFATFIAFFPLAIFCRNLFDSAIFIIGLCFCFTTNRKLAAFYISPFLIEHIKRAIIEDDIDSITHKGKNMITFN